MNVIAASKRDPSSYKKIERNGYLLVRAGKWYQYEHRVVMEQILGRPLLSTEIVHHLNHDRQDNRPENLELVSGGQSEHKLVYHRHAGKGVPRPSLQKPKIGCPVCGVPFKPIRRYRLPDGTPVDTVTCSFSCSNRLRPRGVLEPKTEDH